MDFDPDAYLRDKSAESRGGFDPDAYLAQRAPQTGGYRATGKPGGFVQGIDPMVPNVPGTVLSPADEGAYQKWRSGLPSRLQETRDYDLRGFWKKNPNFSINTPGQHLTDEFKLPTHDTFSNESKYYNPQTAQYGGQWSDHGHDTWDFIPNDPSRKRPIHEVGGERMPVPRPSRDLPLGVRAPGPEPSQFPFPGYENLPREKPLVREDPIGSVIGATAGAKAGMIAAKPILNLATKSALGGAATGLAGSLLGYEASAVPMAAGSAAAVGENPLDAAKRTATDPVALATTGALGALGGAARGHAAAIRDPHNLSGRVLQDVEAAGGKVGIGGPRGGLFEAPEFTGLDKGRAGINDLAGKSAERIAADNAERLTKAREAFGDAADQIIAEHGDRHIPTLNSHRALDAVDAENTVNGVIGNDKVASATAKLRQMLTTETGQLDAQASAAAGKPVMVSAPAVKAGDLIKTRKLVNRMLRQTQEPAEKHVFGQALSGLAEDAAAVDPRIGQMNAAFKQEMQQLSTVNEALFGQRRPELNGAMSASQQAAGRLGRIGDETQAGTLAQQRMQAAADASPQVQRELLLNRAKKAQERLRLSGDETSTSIEKGAGNAVHRGVKHAVGAAIGGVLGHTVGGPVGAGVGSAAGTAAAGLFANPLALKLRLGLPVADAAGRVAGRPAMTFGQMSDMARQRREADAAAAARLMGQ